MATAVDPMVGRVIDGRYRLLSVIAEGGMGVVYLAEHTVIGRRVAVKVLRPELATDVDIGERFLEEARAAGTLGHPNIVECTDFGSTNDDRPYLVMELLEGNDLAEELRRASPFPVRRVISIARQIASALAAAHAKGIVHRDLKPENVFLVSARGDDEGRDHVKLLDFGISKFLNRPSGPRTQRGLTMGTPDFMAPEQISDPDRVDIRSDVHALGGLMYEMLVGRSPYGGGSQQNVVMRILHQAPRPIAELRADVPGAVIDFLNQCLAKDPDARPQTMGAVIELLGQFRFGTPTALDAGLGIVEGRAPTIPSFRIQTEVPGPTPSNVAVLDGGRMTPGAQVAGGTPAAQVMVTPAPEGRSNRLLLGVGALALLALGGVIVVLAKGNPPAPTAPAPTPPSAAIVVDAGAPPAPAKVLLEITTPAPGAMVTLRGQTFPIPFSAEVDPGSNQELVEITAPGHEGRRIWVTLDRARYLDLQLPVGAGIATASDTEVKAATASGDQARTERQQRGQSIVRTPVGSGRPVAPAGGSASGSASGSATVTPSGVDAAPTPSIDAGIAIDAAPMIVAPTGSGSGSAPAIVGPKPGTIDSAGVKAVVRAHAGEVSSCYERARMENHSQPLRGRLSVQVNVDATGRVTAAKVASSTLSASRLEQCVVDAVKRWSFPAPAGGVAGAFSYPFVFQ